MADGDIRVVHPPGSPEFLERVEAIDAQAKKEKDPVARSIKFLALVLLIGIGDLTWAYKPMRDHNAALARQTEARTVEALRLTGVPSMNLSAFETPRPVITGTEAVFTYPTEMAPYQNGVVFRVWVKVSKVGVRGPSADTPWIPATDYAEDPATFLSSFRIPASHFAGSSGERFLIEPRFIVRRDDGMALPFKIDPRKRAYFDVP